MASVGIKDVRKAYGQLEIVHGVSLDIADGEFVALVGPSGCGKSTLLRMIAGLEKITSGEIAIGGRVVNGVAPKDRDVAMVFQNYALYPHMTVADNMAFSLKLKKAEKTEAQARVARAAAILGLGNLLARYPRELSGGQRQRVAMGRAIVRDPQVFLFDEPLSNLDAKLRVSMRGEIKSLHSRLGTTTVYVTHDQVEAMTMADRIVVMRDGRIEQIGAPLGVYDAPANKFVAEFIGSPSMNFIPGRVSNGTFEADGGPRFRLHPRAGRADGDVLLGVRPEHFVVVEEDHPNALDGEVTSHEPTGSETQLVVRVGGVEMTCLLRQRISARLGERVRIAAQPEHFRLFDRDTENAIA